jgi:hypothetical protein
VLVLGLAVALPVLLRVDGPTGVPYRWPGVEAAYRTVENLGPEALVVVYWAYDPATAGEMDLVMQPVIRHLLAQRVRLAVVSPLPGGTASARRLFDRVRSGLDRPSALALAAETSWPTTFSYLPGGAAVLPLLARTPASVLLEEPDRAAAEVRRAVAQRPALALVAAAHAEDAQDWLEQVQPLDGAPVVAVTGAGADPILRPYLDSGQVRGLVSGFDGAYAYQQLLEPFAARAGPPWLARQLILQNWGQLALLAVIALGNLAALLGREEGS